MNMTARDVNGIARMNTNPLPYDRSLRQVNQMAATSVPAGKMTPIAAFPLLREDALRTSMMSVRVDLQETAEIIRNGVKCRMMAYFVPFLAFERFNGGMDEFNRSYQKQNIADGATITPFFNSMTAGVVGSIPIHKYLGFHAAPTDVINTSYIEAYNAIFNFRIRNRSETLWAAKKRLATDTSLAPAMWVHEQFKYVVPDWDDRAMEGSVDLTFTNQKAYVSGIGFQGAAVNTTAINVKESGQTSGTSSYPRSSPTRGLNDQAYVRLTAADYPDIYADLQTTGIKISLANIALATKTQKMAELKAKYEGLSDAFIVDLLMQGIQVPDQVWKQPILIADQTAIFGIEKRWATDGANLSNGVVNGAAAMDLNIALPRCPTGGIVMVVAEILPEQLWERMRDPLLFTTDPAKLPNALKDYLDPQKVERMSNGEVDTAHPTPNGLFGYRPLNWMWQASSTRLGGKWFKSAPSNTFNQDRQQFWTVEQTAPQMNSDFMLSEVMNQWPFVVTNQDIGEAQLHGTALIEGNTQFGERLLENDNAYNEVINAVDQTRITKGV